MSFLNRIFGKGKKEPNKQEEKAIANIPVGKNEYKIGQVWEYQTREGEEKSKLTIIKVNIHENYGTIVNIAVDKVKIKSSYTEDGYLHGISHLPFNKEAIDNSVTNLVGKSDDLSESQEGYDEWKEQFDLGKAGIFTGTVAETISAMETSINQ